MTHFTGQLKTLRHGDNGSTFSTLTKLKKPQLKMNKSFYLLSISFCIYFLVFGITSSILISITSLVICHLIYFLFRIFYDIKHINL